MSDTTAVASNAHTAIRIHHPAHYDEAMVKGLPVVHTDILGSSHPDAVSGHGITAGVDAATLAAWLEAHPEHVPIMRAVTLEEVAAMLDTASQYGHEPGVEAAAKDAENIRLNALGPDYDPADVAPQPAQAAQQDKANPAPAAQSATQVGRQRGNQPAAEA